MHRFVREGVTRSSSLAVCRLCIHLSFARGSENPPAGEKGAQPSACQNEARRAEVLLGLWKTTRDWLGFVGSSRCSRAVDEYRKNSSHVARLCFPAFVKAYKLTRFLVITVGAAGFCKHHDEGQHGEAVAHCRSRRKPPQRLSPRALHSRIPNMQKIMPHGDLVTVVSTCGTEQVMGWRRMLD